MKTAPISEIEEHPDGAKRRDDALSRALKMPPTPFTPKVTPKAKTKKKTGAKAGSKASGHVS